MNKNFKGVLPFLMVGIFASAGCAKHEVIKKDEGIAPAAAKPAVTEEVKTPPAPQQTAAEPKVAPVSGTEVKEPAANAGEAGSAANLQQSLENIYFGFDSSALSEAARATLSKNLEALKGNGQQKVRIEGYCDERGSDEYNLALGERRARGAARYLATLGVAEKRLSVLSYGNEKPADPGHNEAAWTKNRRDEFVLVK